jgi:hypothetical protein
MDEAAMISRTAAFLMGFSLQPSTAARIVLASSACQPAVVSRREAEGPRVALDGREDVAQVAMQSRGLMSGSTKVLKPTSSTFSHRIFGREITSMCFALMLNE